MADFNLNSGDIKVFPTTKRAGHQRDARLMTEENSTGTLSHATDFDSFVIASPSMIVDTLIETLSFCIKGYYFEITDVASFLADIATNLSSATEIYATITLVATTGTKTVGQYTYNYSYTQLSGQDTGDIGSPSSLYNGITFSDSASTEANTFSLQLLKKVTVSGATYWIVPEESVVKFDYAHIAGVIDCGEI
jgi:hypothetical protein